MNPRRTDTVTHATGASVCLLRMKPPRALRRSAETSCDGKSCPGHRSGPGAAAVMLPCDDVFLTPLPNKNHTHENVSIPDIPNALKQLCPTNDYSGETSQALSLPQLKNLKMTQISSFLSQAIKNKHKISVSSSPALLNNLQIMLS